MGVRVEIVHVIWKFKLTIVISGVRSMEGGGGRVDWIFYAIGRGWAILDGNQF